MVVYFAGRELLSNEITHSMLALIHYYHCVRAHIIKFLCGFKPQYCWLQKGYVVCTSRVTNVVVRVTNVGDVLLT